MPAAAEGARLRLQQPQDGYVGMQLRAMLVPRCHGHKVGVCACAIRNALLHLVLKRLHIHTKGENQSQSIQRGRLAQGSSAHPETCMLQ